VKFYSNVIESTIAYDVENARLLTNKKEL